MFEKRKRSWKELIERQMESSGESFSDIIYCTLSIEELSETFECDYGCENGKPFFAWTEKYIYFPLAYDGYQFVRHVPRSPVDNAFFPFSSEYEL